MKKFIIENEKISKLLKEKDVLSARMNELTKEGERIQKEGDEIIQKLARADESVRPMIEKEYSKFTLEEYEEFTVARLILEGKDKGKIELKASNLLEEFKIFYKENKGKNEKDNGRDTKSKITDTGDNA